MTIDLHRTGIEAAPDAAGIVFGWHQNSRGNTYAFLAEKNGSCKFLEESNNGWSTESQGQVDNFLTRKEVHTITVVHENRHVIGFVDGDYCDDYEMPSYEPGYIGLAALSGHRQEVGSVGFFDNARFANLPERNSNQ